MHKIMFSAGEVSGDMHGANLAEALKKIEPEIKLVGFGGNMMEEAGVALAANMSQYSVMGFYEVLRNLPRMFELRSKLSALMEKERPDVLVLIDYPDFNWRLAPIAKRLNIPVFSYIPPSAWAWRKGRAKEVARIADQIAAIFPFEMDVYKQAGANIEFVGNPLVETVKPSLTKKEAYRYFSIDPSKKNILLLPGSRRQEIKAIFPVMVKSAKLLQAEHADIEFHTMTAQGIKEEDLRETARDYDVNIKYHNDKLYDLMAACDAALATSGTVVLEAALMGLPSVVLYRMSAITYYIAKLFVNVEFFSLPNILAQKQIIPELLQDEVTPQNIMQAAEVFLTGENSEVQDELKQVKLKLGSPGVSERTARLIIKTADEGVSYNRADQSSYK